MNQAMRRQILVVGSAIFVVLVAVANGVLNDRADREAAALRSEVELKLANLGDVAPTDFWILANDAPPMTSSIGPSRLETAGGERPDAMVFDRGQTFALYRIESWGKERCVRLVFSASGVEIGDRCVLVDRVAN